MCDASVHCESRVGGCAVRALVSMHIGYSWGWRIVHLDCIVIVWTVRFAKWMGRRIIYFIRYSRGLEVTTARHVVERGESLC